MNLNDDEIRYKQAIDILKGLPEVKAPVRFEADLMRRINSGETVKENTWLKIFMPSRLIPSAAAAAAAVIMIFMLNTSNVQQDDPLTLHPRIREDAANVSGSNLTGNISSVIPASAINKSGLYFRQINLTPQQREKLNQLKAKINHYLHQNDRVKQEK